MLTVKEYAKHVGSDARTVRRWMKDGLLKFTQPRGHRARLINSTQPRPVRIRKKKAIKSTDTARQNIESVANVPRQADRRSQNVSSQPRERTARPLCNPTFEKKKLKSLRPKPIERKSISSEPVSDDSGDFCDWFSFEIDNELVKLAVFFWAGVKLLPKILSQIR